MGNLHRYGLRMADVARLVHYWGYMSVERNLIRKPDLIKLRDLPHGEAMRIAMIKYGWDVETAGRVVVAEQCRRARKRGQNARCRKAPRGQRIQPIAQPAMVQRTLEGPELARSSRHEGR